MKHSLILLVLFAVIACGHSEKPKSTSQAESIQMEQLTKEQTAFVKDWVMMFNSKNVPILNIFRNRHFKQTDIKQLDKYFTHNKLVVDFKDAKQSIKIKTDLTIDTSLTPDIKWINDDDVTICNKVDPDFWGCFEKRYDIEGFYYLSMPLFSSDKKWCLLSVNYLSKLKKQSYGGGRLYHFEKGKWEEKAFLSYWGKQPE
jgi:hypothetical protein